jgi:hypothetical protein
VLNIFNEEVKIVGSYIALHQRNSEPSFQYVFFKNSI